MGMRSGMSKFLLFLLLTMLCMTGPSYAHLFGEPYTLEDFREELYRTQSSENKYPGQFHQNFLWHLRDKPNEVIELLQKALVDDNDDIKYNALRVLSESANEYSWILRGFQKSFHEKS